MPCCAALRCAVQVELTLGGPVAPGHRRPLTFQLDPLDPASSTAWETELRVSGFGWPAVQPALRLPVKVRCRSWAGAAAGVAGLGRRRRVPRSYAGLPCPGWPGGRMICRTRSVGGLSSDGA